MRLRNHVREQTRRAWLSVAASLLALVGLLLPCVQSQAAPRPTASAPKVSVAELPERVSRHSIDVPELGGTFDYLVWRPPVTVDKSKKYPLIVMLHGLGGGPANFIEFARMHERLDAAVKSGRLVPCFAVMVQGRNGYWSNWKDGKHAYADLVTHKFMPHLRKELPVSDSAAKTALMGASMGGFGALSIGLMNPALFGVIVALSPTDMQFAAQGSPKRKFYTDVFGVPISMAAVKRVNPYHLVLAGKGKGQVVLVAWGAREGRKFKAGSERLIIEMKRRRLSVKSLAVAGGRHGWASAWSKSHGWWLGHLGRVWRR